MAVKKVRKKAVKKVAKGPASEKKETPLFMLRKGSNDFKCELLFVDRVPYSKYLPNGSNGNGNDSYYYGIVPESIKKGVKDESKQTVRLLAPCGDEANFDLASLRQLSKGLIQYLDLIDEFLAS